MASGVDMVLLMRVLAVLISAVGFVTSPGLSIIFPTSVSLVMWVSDFCNFISQDILPYTTFRSCGTCDFGMKNILFNK